MFSRSILITLFAILAIANAQGNGNGKGNGNGNGNGNGGNGNGNKGNGNGIGNNGNGNGNQGNMNGGNGGGGNGNIKNSICKPFKGIGGPSFGLCNAYCKAKKCQEKDGLTKSCTKLKEKFMRKTGESKMPCDAEVVETDAPTMAATTTTPTIAPSSLSSSTVTPSSLSSLTVPPSSLSSSTIPSSSVSSTAPGNGKRNSFCKQFKGMGGPSFGLCNAYCKAKKCQEKDELTKSCTKLKGKFMRKTGESKMPCDAEVVETDAPTMAATTTTPTIAPSSLSSSVPSSSISTTAPSLVDV